MPENTRLSGSIDQIELGFVKREATPKLLMKLGIHPHLAGLSLSNTIFILEIFGVERARSTVQTSTSEVYYGKIHSESGR
jgi:hypothetical protein